VTKPWDLGKLIASGGGFGTSEFPKYQKISKNPIQFDDFPIFPHIVSLRPPFIGIPLFHGDFHVKPVDFNAEQIRCLGAASPWGWTRICVARHPWGLPLMLDATPGHGGFWRFLEVSGWENRRTN